MRLRTHPFADMTVKKRCNVCGQKKPLTAFHKDRSRPGGRVPTCTECAQEYHTQGAGKDARRKYEQTEKRKDAEARYRHTKGGRAVRDRVREVRDAAIKATTIPLTNEEWDEVLRLFPVCPICRRPFSKNLPPTVEHIIPLSQGGEHALGNVLPLCQSCNSSRGSGVRRTSSDPDHVPSCVCRTP